MCGRYTVFTEDEIAELRAILNEINERYKHTQLHAAMATGEVRPTNVAPVLTADGPHLMRWGFPSWKGSGVLINARAETAPEKPTFKQSLLSRRCVIPSAGFFEWSHDAGPKIKYLCRLHETPLLLMAGIYNLYANEHGEKEEHYAILTTDANADMAPVHDRMPVILRPNEKNAWIKDPGVTMDILHRPGPALLLTAVGGYTQGSLF